MLCNLGHAILDYYDDDYDDNDDYDDDADKDGDDEDDDHDDADVKWMHGLCVHACIT